MKQALLIVNPHSGQKNGVKLSEGIRDRLAGKGINSELFVSVHTKALEEFLAKRSLNDFDFVGLVGGDGTMHTFLNAALSLYDNLPLPIAIFPCGTGNAFNCDIGCGTIEDTLQSIYTNDPVFIDVAEVSFANERLWSFNILGCGLVARINGLAERLRWLGAPRYTVSSLIGLFANPISHLKVTTDEKVFEGKYSFVLACNTRYTGKGMLMAPHAKLSDGKFDVILVKACSALTLLRLFPKIFKGEHLGAEVLEYVQTATLNVTSDNGSALPTIIDGEQKGETPFSFRIRANKVKVFMK
jgi:diacylglycerol kinase (ATP)